MNHIRGRVQVRETGVGVPGLVIVVYDLDPRSSPEEVFENIDSHSSRDLWTRLNGDRLGSVPTGADGSFSLYYKNDDFQQRDRERRPDLLLLVTAPEVSGADNCPEILHVSCGIRQNAGRNEYYLVHLPLERLRKIGTRAIADFADDPNDPDTIVRRRQRAVEEEEQIRHGLRKIALERVEGERRRRSDQKERFADPARLLSSVSKEVRQSDRYVAPGESVEEKTFRVIRRGIEEQLHSESRTRKIGILSLSPEQRTRLSDDEGNLRVGLAASDLTSALYGPSTVVASFLPIDLVRLDPLDYCRDQSHPDERCPPPPENGGARSVPVENGDDDADSSSGSEDSAALTVEDVPRLIARLVDTMTAPETTVQLDSGSRADPGKVQGYIDGLKLKGGPADTPAFHDFHQLQIAFDHVWQEAFDDDLFSHMKETYKQIEDLGGDPGKAFADVATENAATALLEEGKVVDAANANPLPVAVIQVFEITDNEWTALALSHQEELKRIAIAVASSHEDAREVADQAAQAAQAGGPIAMLADPLLQTARILGQEERRLRQAGEKIIRHAKENLAARTGYISLHQLLKDLRKRLREKYAFTIYAANREGERSINFGLLVTYRQKWEPLSYQAGELAKTVTLAPKETRKFTKKIVIKRRRSEKELTNSLRSQREDMTQTSRIETEILRRADNKTNFNLKTDTGFDFLGFTNKVNTDTTTEAGAGSQEVKKEFREAVLKSAEEVKQERTIEVNTEQTDDLESEESGEISNPNDELPVTFLFYELQRRYRVSERINRARPVILVAQEMPYPHEIDEDWLVAHDWILRRVLLDDSFSHALTYLSTRIVGDEFSLGEMQKNIQQQRSLIDEIGENVGAYHRQSGQRYAALEQSIQRRINAVNSEENEGLLEGIVELFTGELQADSPEGARLREEAAQTAYENAAKEERDLRGRLEREVTALNVASEAYAKALADHLNRKTQVERLKVHVKQNIMYYMQAIWSHEPPDQRFFRLHNVKVPDFSGQVKFNIKPNTLRNAVYSLPHFHASQVEAEVECDIKLPLDFSTLSKVADLDNLLGFKGNFMIFPLKVGNCLTDFMMIPYIDAALGLRDPDDMGNWTVDEFVDYVCCLQRHTNPDAFAALRGKLREQFKEILSAPRRDVDEIVVPTGSLFIEALPGTYPILEDFKLKHRAIDARRAQADLRRVELENLRLAARLLTDEYEDPDVERKIVIEGDNLPSVVVGDNPIA